jgi:hypothetical protein
MTTTTRVFLIALVLQLHPQYPVSAQPAQLRGSGDVTVAPIDSVSAERRPSASVAHPNRAGIAGRRGCTLPGCASFALEPAQDSTVSVKRGRYAWWGLAIGAGLGWFISAEACRRTDCYGTGFGLAIVVGGAVGLIVGLLVSPG